MVSKAKKTTALLLAALMCAGVLAGCGGGGNGGETTSTASGTTSTASGTTSTASSSSTAAPAPTIEQMVAKIKEEASANGGKVEIKVWAPGGDKNFVKAALNGDKDKNGAYDFTGKGFKDIYKADGVTYDFKVVEVGENDAVGKLTEDPTKAADVFQFPTDTLLRAVQAQAIAEVPALLQGQINDENMEDAVANTKVDEKIYAYPMTSDNGYILFYDKATFTEDDVKSFEGLLDKAKEKSATVLMALDNAWYNAGFFYAAGCDIKLDTSTNKMTLEKFTGDEGVNAVKAMKDLADNYSGVFIPSGDDAAIASYLNDGKLKAVVTGTWNTATLQKVWGKDNVGAAKLPTVKLGGKDTQLNSFGGYKLVGVNSQSKYTITSAIIASYLTGKDVQEQRYKGRNLIPTNKELRESDEVKNNPIVAAIDAQMPFAHSQSVCTQAFWDPIAAVGKDATTGNFNSDDDIKKALETQVKSVENA